MKLPNDISNDWKSQNWYRVLFSVTRFLISRTPYSPSYEDGATVSNWSRMDASMDAAEISGSNFGYATGDRANRREDDFYEDFGDAIDQLGRSKVGLFWNPKQPIILEN